MTSDSANEWREPLRIDDTHPSLPGHFPGQPVVPGVLLLDRIAARVHREGAGTLARIAQVKFRAPLLPGEQAELHILRQGSRLVFRVSRGDAVLMTGEGELA